MPVEVRSDFGGVYFTSVTYDAASLAAGTAVDATITVPGVLSTDKVVAVTPPAAYNGGLSVQSARVSGANAIQARLFNSTAGALDAASGTWEFQIGRR